MRRAGTDRAVVAAGRACPPPRYSRVRHASTTTASINPPSTIMSTVISGLVLRRRVIDMGARGSADPGTLCGRQLRMQRRLELIEDHEEVANELGVGRLGGGGGLEGATGVAVSVSVSAAAGEPPPCLRALTCPRPQRRVANTPPRANSEATAACRRA